MKTILTLGLASACGIFTANAAVIAEAGGGTTGTAQSIDASLDGGGAFSHTITGGVGGDGVLVGSGVITTVDAPGGYPGGVTPAGQQVTHTGTPSGSFVVTTGAAGSGYPDMDVRQFSDNTFATQIGGHDNDRGASNSEETPYGSPLTATVDLTNNINLEFHEVGGADFTPSITFGYEVFDISSATHRTDFFSFNSLASGTTFSAEVLTDQATFGFFDSRLTFYNSAGTQISTHDSDAGTGAHELVTGVVVPGDGILIVEVNNSKSTNGIVGTYNLAVSGTAVPEPTSSALLGLGGLALILRRRK